MKKNICLMLGIIVFFLSGVMNVKAGGFWSMINSYSRVDQIVSDCDGCVSKTFPYDTHTFAVETSYNFDDSYYFFKNDYFVLDLKGETLTNKNIENEEYKILFEISNGARFTIIDSVGGGKIEGGILVTEGGTLIVDSGIIGHSDLNYGGITINEGTVTINGGTFLGKDGGIKVLNPSAVLKIKSGSFESEGANNYGGISVIKQVGTSFSPNSLLTEGSKLSNISFDEKTIGDDGYYVSGKSINVYEKHNINIDEEITNGTIRANTNSEYCDETVTFSITPDAGYQTKSVKVYKNSTDITDLVEYNATNKTFTMPNYDVTLTAEFELIPVAKYTVKFDSVTGVSFNKTSPITVESGDDQEITIIADTGYRLTSVKVNGVEKIPLTNNKVVLTNIIENKEVVVTAEKIEYDVTDGNGQKYTIGNSEGIVFRIDADKSLFNKVYLNDEELDSKYYKITEGSTIITLNQDFLNDLLPGTYKLKAIFSDGGEANTTFSVATPVVENPKTGDSIGIFIFVSLISIFSISSGMLVKKRFY